jgi:thymidylate synthase ThyX
MISAKLIAYSTTSYGDSIATFELEYPRFIHSEFMTHRLFSRNAASSRAIPVNTLIGLVEEAPAMPVHWGQNQPGMQAKVELADTEKDFAQFLWKDAAYNAADSARELNKLGLHKQVANRILEPFQNIKVVVTATSYDNFFWLRNHEDAQPEIKVLAQEMLRALDGQTAAELKAGDWHVPYFGEGYWLQGCGIPLEDALAISSSCCAQVSYRRLDDTLEKAQIIFQRLVDSKPVHASPFEHQATPMKSEQFVRVNDYGDNKYYFGDNVNQAHNASSWEKGVTHADRSGKLHSGNFIGWVQHRQLLEDHVCNNYEGGV